MILFNRLALSPISLFSYVINKKVVLHIYAKLLLRVSIGLTTSYYYQYDYYYNHYGYYCSRSSFTHSSGSQSIYNTLMNIYKYRSKYSPYNPPESCTECKNNKYG